MNSIKQIEVIYADRIVGRLAMTKEGLSAFEYSPEWLASGFSISPFVFAAWSFGLFGKAKTATIWRRLSGGN